MINGKPGDDELPNNVGENDTIDGGTGNDTVSYAGAGGGGGGVVVILHPEFGFAADPSNGDSDALISVENVIGSAFGDVISGDDQANVIDGGAGLDVLSGGGGDDALRGSEGDDQLFGDAGADAFNYSFSVTPGVGEVFHFTDFFAARGGRIVDGEVADGTKLGQFTSSYLKWIKMLVKEEGLGSGGIQDLFRFGEVESFTWKTGSGKKAKTHEAQYFDTWSSGDAGDAVTSADGLDTILDFSSDDTLNFSGITRDQFLANFNADASSNVAGGAAMDTVVTIEGFDGWSLTLADVSLSLTAVADETVFS